MRCTTRGSLTRAGDDERGATVVRLRGGHQRRGASAPAYRCVAGGAGGPDPAVEARVAAPSGHRSLLADGGAGVGPPDDSGAGGGVDPGPGAGGGALAGDSDRAGRHAGHRGRAAARGTPAAAQASVRLLCRSARGLAAHPPGAGAAAMRKHGSDDPRIAQLREEIAADLMALRRRSGIHPPWPRRTAGAWTAPAARLRGVPAWAFGALAGLLAAVWSALRRPRSAR